MEDLITIEFTRNYSMFRDQDSSMMCKDADATITKLQFWEWLKDFNPAENEGFMFTQNENVLQIYKELSYKGHSAFTFAWTMRQMKYVSVHGYEKFKDLVISKL